MKFDELDLYPELKKGIDEAGFSSCMPVQAGVFPPAFAGEDIYAQSQTGTGKTAAFLVSIFQRIMTVPDLRTRKALILAPTRELAAQIEEETKRLGKYLPIRAGAFFGGVGYGPQLDMLKANVQIIIGTPGRVIDLLKQGKMLLKDVGFLVIDEADRMFDMGFIDDLRLLLRYLPPPEKRQTYLFSATLSERVRHLAWDYMREPKEIVIHPESVTVELVTQEVHHVASNEKFRLLLGVLNRDKPGSAIIFCNQKYMVEEVARRLRMNGIPCEFIMGDLPQSKRLEIINHLKSGALGLLVATDVAARGLDIEALDMVINYDVPLDAESYVHRIGRTARAGKSGKAVTLACEKFVYGLPAIEEFINMKIPVAPFNETLLLADKSAGMHFARGKEREASSRRGDRPYHRTPRGSKEIRGAEITREPRGGARPSSSSVRSKKPRPASSQPASVVDHTPKKPQAASASELYGLSLDERMRLYKEKYGTGSAQPRDRSASSRDSDRKAAPKQKRDTYDRSRAYRSPSRTSNAVRPTEAATPRQAPDKAPAPPETPQTKPKRGLLGIAARLFKRKG